MKTGHGPLSIDLRYGSISITGRPFSADVYLDENYEGEIPCTVEHLEAGAYKLRVKKENFKDHKERVMVKPDETLYLKVYLEPKW
jgi:hypothetical protein